MSQCHLLVMRPRETKDKIKIEYSMYQTSGYHSVYTIPYGHSGVYRVWASNADIISRCYILEKFALEQENKSLY